MDVSEVEVSGTPVAVPPTPTPTPTPTPPTPPTTAERRDDDAHDAARHEAQGGPQGHGQGARQLRHREVAPAGSARLRILGRRSKPIAEGSLTVRPSRTSTKTIRLTKRGRKQIRRGKTKTVMLELRLPGGPKVKKTLKLARARR